MTAQQPATVKEIHKILEKLIKDGGGDYYVIVCDEFALLNDRPTIEKEDRSVDLCATGNFDY